MAKHASSKRLQIDKDQARIVTMLAISSAILVFSLVASRTLISKMLHQNRVIAAEETALEQLNTNIEELDKLQSAYRTFEDSPESVLGNSGEKNSKVILDALPSKYDFAALLTSIEQILLAGDYEILGITGVDQELEVEQISSTPEPIEIPLTISINTNYVGAQTFLDSLSRSIRPFNIKTLLLTGGDDNLTVTVDLVTYYQPETNLDIQTEVIE